MAPAPSAPVSSALDLLHVATELLREDLLPALPADTRRAALMLGHALGIVGRELTMTAHLLEIERGVLSRFVRPPSRGGGESELPLDGLVLGLRRQFVAGLRAGAFDADDDALRQALHSLVRLRCSVDAPKALA